MQKQVLIYTIIISAIYMVYLYIAQKMNIYRYVIYLLVIILLIILDTLKLRKKGEESYSVNILILSICMAIFTKEQIFLLTVIYTLLACSMYLLLKKINQKSKKYIKQENKQSTKLPIAFFMCICNMILYIFINFAINYIL